MLELTILLISIVIVMYYIYNQDNQYTESFDDITSCPPLYNQHLRADGKIICYLGTDYSVTDPQCILNGTDSKIQNCAVMIESENKKLGKRCPRSLPKYFDKNNQKGCVPLRSTYTSTNKCIIYDTNKLNYNSIDSCANRILKDNALKAFKGDNYKINVVTLSNNTPALIEVKIIKNTGSLIAYTRESVQRYIEIVMPNMINKKEFIEKSCKIAEVAKEQYITMDKSTCS